MRRISDKIMYKIEEIYVNDETITLTDLAKRFQFSREAIKLRLKKRNIRIRVNKEIYKIKRLEKVMELCKIYDQVKSLRKVRKITGHSINFIKRCIKGKVNFPIYPKPLKKGYEKITKEKVRICAALELSV